MKRSGILAVCTVAVFATTTVATATEELPEIGRCVKPLGGATHRYTNAGCTAKSAGENTGKYEWEPGPGPKRGFTAVAEASEVETVGLTKLLCHAGTAKGEFTGPKSDTAVITFTGCEYGAGTGLLCASPGAKAGEIVTARLVGSLGFISGGGTSNPRVGMRLAPASGTRFATVECTGYTVTLTGSVIGVLPALSTDKMMLTSTISFKASRGKQNPEALAGGPLSVLTATSGKESEQAGLTSTEANTNEETLEVKAIS
jgi:hypothetical protein